LPMTDPKQENHKMPRIMDLRGISGLLFISDATVHRWIRGGMPHLQAMKGGKLLFDIDRVTEWMVTSTPAIDLKIQKIRRINHA